MRLVVPATLTAQLDVTASPGGVHVDAGGVTYDGHDFRGAIGGGGPFTVRVRAEDGSIAVLGRGGP